MTTITIDRLQPLPKEGYRFNTLLECFDEVHQESVQMIIAGWRIMQGKIYPPAIAYGRGRYFNAIHLDTDTSAALYSQLQALLPDYKLMDETIATASFVMTQKALDSLLPTIAAERG